MSERVTPYELIFGRTGLAAKHFPRIADAFEAGERPGRERFLAAGEAGELMAELIPETAEGTAQIGLLSYQAFRRWQEGGPDREIDDTKLRELLGRGGLGGWQLQPPAPAGYFQLPRHQWWVAGEPGEPAEPVDGFFWVSGEPQGDALELLLVLGVREDRPGVTVIELRSGPLPAEGHWGDLQARPEGKDFSNILPGGEHLYGLAAAGEVLKLASRLFWQVRADG